ncbi:unnamed protein product, partial [marine sediment metagenome]
MDNLEEVQEKIRKLLALADNNPNANEAAAAAGAAQRLMERYRIDQISYRLTHDDADGGSGDSNSEPISQSDEPLDSAGRLSQWRINLADALARANGCRIWILHQRIPKWNERQGRYRDSSRKEITMAGRKADISIIRYMYDYLVKEIDRLCKNWCYDQSFSRRDGRTAGNNFRLGAVEIVRNRMMKARNEARDAARKEAKERSLEGETNAIAIVDKSIAAIDELEGAVESWMEN